MLPEAEHYSDNALKATRDRIGFDFNIKINGEGESQKIDLEIKNINSEKCHALLQTREENEIRNKCFDFLKTTLCGKIKEELIQDKKIDSEAIDEDKLVKSEDKNKIVINSSIEKITKKLWYERTPFAALVNIGPNGTILLLEHNTRKLELGGGRGGTPYHPKFSAMAETQGEICAIMKKSSEDLIPLSGFYERLSREKGTKTRMNGDCFFAPWGTWGAKGGEIKDPGESNREFTNDHSFTKCWSFADLRMQANNGKLIRTAFDGIPSYLSKKEEEIYSNLQQINSKIAKDDNYAVIIVGSKKTIRTEFDSPKEIGVIYIKKTLIEEAKLREITGSAIKTPNLYSDYHIFKDIQPDQLVSALKHYNQFKQGIELAPAQSYNAHKFSEIDGQPDIVSETNKKILQAQQTSAEAHNPSLLKNDIGPSTLPLPLPLPSTSPSTLPLPLPLPSTSPSTSKIRKWLCCI